MRAIGVAAIVSASNAVPVSAAAHQIVVESFSLTVPPSFPTHNVAAIVSTPRLAISIFRTDNRRARPCCSIKGNLGRPPFGCLGERPAQGG